jgi:hypothetical protein
MWPIPGGSRHSPQGLLRLVAGAVVGVAVVYFVWLGLLANVVLVLLRYRVLLSWVVTVYFLMGPALGFVAGGAAGRLAARCDIARGWLGVASALVALAAFLWVPLFRELRVDEFSGIGKSVPGQGFVFSVWLRLALVGPTCGYAGDWLASWWRFARKSQLVA